jgi:FkbH-like protein
VSIEERNEASKGEHPGSALADRPSAHECLQRAQEAFTSDPEEAVHWLRRLVDAEATFSTWNAAAALLARLPDGTASAATTRSARIAVVGSYTTAQFVPMLRLAALRAGIDATLYEGGYGTFEQEILGADSELHAFEPTHVVLAVHEGAVRFEAFSETPDADLEAETNRWTTLWHLARERGARIVQHTFATRGDSPFGHLAMRLPGTRENMLRALNQRIGQEAGGDTLLVDCDRLAARFGKSRWFDDRYWHLAKQAVALDALPSLAVHTAAVIAGDLGLAKKCIVLDLDNTLWGGVVGEDGLAGIRLGHGPEGEAYTAFQEAILGLKRRGIILAVCSKNNEADALAPFSDHPDMRLRLDDIASFSANWRHKPDNLREIAQELDLGLDALVYVDDNPAERAVVRQALPDVDVISLPRDPAVYARALLEYPYFESTTYSAEDTSRTEQYKARKTVRSLQSSVVDIDSFLRELEMVAEIAPFDALHLPRIVQLIGKTNQFNLTTRRHSQMQIESFMGDARWVHVYLKLRDRFADHGLVAVALAEQNDAVLDIDTFLMSCRVIGRTAERALLARLSQEAMRLDCTRIRGTYVRTERNGLVETMYREHGFEPVSEDLQQSVWEYDLSLKGPIVNDYIAVEEP